jgi:hypothetical protein
MTTPEVIVLEVAAQEPVQVTLVEDDDVVQALAADAADHPSDEGVLPGAPRSGDDLFGSHGLDALLEGGPVYAVAVAEQEAWGLLPGKRLGDLPGGPARGRMLGDVEVEDATTGVGEHDEDEQDLESHRGDHEEVDGNEVLNVVL